MECIRQNIKRLSGAHVIQDKVYWKLGGSSEVDDTIIQAKLQQEGVFEVRNGFLGV